VERRAATRPAYFSPFVIGSGQARLRGTVWQRTVRPIAGIGNMMMIASSTSNRATCVAGVFVLRDLGICLYVGFPRREAFHRGGRTARARSHCITHGSKPRGGSRSPEHGGCHHAIARAPRHVARTIGLIALLRFRPRASAHADQFHHRFKFQGIPRLGLRRRDKVISKAEGSTSRATRGKARPQLSRAS